MYKQIRAELLARIEKDYRLSYDEWAELLTSIANELGFLKNPHD